MTGDQLALSRKPVPHFSWSRAGGHFMHGLGQELKQMVLTPFQHPIATLAMVGASAALVWGAPLIGISAMAVGNAMLLGFTAAAVWRVGTGVTAAWRAYRQQDFTKAETSFEEIGAGGADLAATVGVVAGNAIVSTLKRTEIGQAAGQLYDQSTIAKAIASVKGRAYGFASRLFGHAVKLAEGQEGKVAAIGAQLKAPTGGPQGLSRTLERLNAWRGKIAQSGTVRGINRVFDEGPSQLAERLEGRVISAVNYRPESRALRDKLLTKVALNKGESLDQLRAEIMVRRTVPPVVGAATEVSPTLWRGPVPTTEADFEYLVKQQHVRTIVSALHPENPNEIGFLVQERALAAKYGVKLIELPLPFGVDPPQAMIDKFLAAVDKGTPDARVYVHCKLGRDRTGTLVAVYREAREGMSGEDALKEMGKFGFDPQRDTYLSYLANYVRTYMQRGAMDLKRWLLVGTQAEASHSAWDVAGGTLVRATEISDRRNRDHFHRG